MLVLLLTVAILNAAFEERPAIAQERPMSSEEVLKAIRQHDWGIVTRAFTAPPSSTVDEIGRALPQLDSEAREIAVATIERNSWPHSAQLLLRMTGDSTLQVAAGAARALSKTNDVPPINDILAAIPQRENDFVRGRLYLLAGRTNDASKLEALRGLAAKEKNPDVA